MRKKTKKPNSEYYGVYFYKGDKWKPKKDRSKNWAAQVTVNSVWYYLGYYSTAKEAAIAVDIFIIKTNMKKPLNILKSKTICLTI